MLNEDLDSEVDDDVCVSPQVELKRLAPESFVELRVEDGEAAPPYRPKPDRQAGGEEDNFGGAGSEDWSRSIRETFARRSSPSEARASFVPVEGGVASALNLFEVL